jgi:predicted nucleic acid-binding protein
MANVARSQLESVRAGSASPALHNGPRTPEQLAVARSFFGEEGVVAFSEATAEAAARVFRRLGSPRKRAAGVAIGVTASMSGAVLLTRNAADFTGIPELITEAGGRT